MRLRREEVVLLAGGPTEHDAQPWEPERQGSECILDRISHVPPMRPTRTRELCARLRSGNDPTLTRAISHDYIHRAREALITIAQPLLTRTSDRRVN